MEHINFRSLLTDSDDFQLSGITFFQSFQVGSATWFLAGSGATGAVSSFQMQSDGSANLKDINWLTNDLGALSHTGGFLVENGNQSNLITLSRLNGAVMTQTLDNGMLSMTQELLDNYGNSISATTMNTFEHAGQSFLLGAGGDAKDLTLYELGKDGQIEKSTQITGTDTHKTSAEDITDILEVQSGGKTFMVSTSNSDNGVNSYFMNDTGQMEFVDRITGSDGLWTSGLDALTVVEQDGQAFILGVSAAAGTMASIRVNPMGVMFVSDIAYDDRDTRFDGATSIDNFSVNGRNFVLSGGADQGLSLFEVMPQGKLFHLSSIAQDNDWNIGAVQAIETLVQGDTLEILVSGSTTGGIAQLTMPLADFGIHIEGGDREDDLKGTAADDVLFGGAGNDILSGGDGDDILFAHKGQDRLIGGEGADIFVFEADREVDRILDFQMGQDKIDLSDWGRLYDYSELTITTHYQGARIRWNSEEIRVTNAEGGQIDVSEWSADDFLF